MLSPAKFWKLGRLALLALVILMTQGLSISHASWYIGIPPTADATVSQDGPDTVYGFDGNFTVQDLGTNAQAYSYLKLDLSLIPSSYRSVGGKLSLYCNNLIGSPDVSLRAVADNSWGEWITWNYKPAYGNTITHIQVVETGWSNWTIPLANLPITGLVSFMLKMATTSAPGTQAIFYSKDYGSYQPQLLGEVVHKMSPVAISLLLLGD